MRFGDGAKELAALVQIDLRRVEREPLVLIIDLVSDY